MTSLTPRDARRIALVAQGFGKARPAVPSLARMRAMIARLGLLQIDSVNVIIRAHYLPLWSRLGPYARAELDGLAAHGPVFPKPHRRELFEYWGHEASLLPVELQPLLRWRMARAESGDGVWRGIKAVADARPELVAAIHDEIQARGPLSAGELTLPERGRGGWWGWSDSKTVLEWLFWTGRITAVGRRGFERVYDLPERVLPPSVLAMPTPEPRDAARELTSRAARALGVATTGDLRDYWRLPVELIGAAVAELVDAGELLPVTVEGWRGQAWLHRDAAPPRRAKGRALLAPFDSLIFERSRTERLFGFRYRLEIYTPAEKRLHGYYVLPFLLDEQLVARVDLKAERATGRLLVRSAHLEDHATPDKVAPGLAEELKALAAWLGLDDVAVSGQGVLAAALIDAGCKPASMPIVEEA